MDGLSDRLQKVEDPSLLKARFRRSKRGDMAHKVKMNIPTSELAHANVEFMVKKNGRAFGKLLVSKGAVVWRPRSKVKRSRKLSWPKFDQLMAERGRSVRGG